MSRTVLRKLILVWALGLLLATGAARGEQALDYRIDLDAPPALSKLLETHLDLYRWRDSERLDDVQLHRLVRQAPQQIRSLLSTEGYYSAKVVASLERFEGSWRVTLAVDPGEPVRVNQVDLQVTGPFEDASAENNTRLDKIRADWSLRPGAVFRHDDWESAKRNALKSLLLDRYPAASIPDSRATVDPEAHSADLHVVLDSGPPFAFGELEIRGLSRYPRSIVDRLNPIEPGEPYAQAKLLTLQTRLQDSPYFASAAVSVDTDPAQAGRVPVKVEVTELQSRKLGFGIGYSTDTGTRGQVDYLDYDFLDQAWRLGANLKLDQKRQSLGGELQFPLAEKGYRDSIAMLLERTDIAGEVTHKLAVGPKRTFQRGRNEISYGIRYLTETQEVAGVRKTRQATLSPSYSWTIRETDHALYPTRGYLLNIQADGAARALLSDQNFLRLHGRGVYFVPLAKRDQLILRGELGMVAAPSRAGIPSDYLFRTGGDQSVRGYAYQSLGVNEGNAVVGGRYIAVASAEYVHWVAPKWGGALFVDGGHAADSSKDLKPVYGYGAGVRWKSPIGPVGFDLAYGQQSEEVRIHFSVGFNF